MAKTKRRQEEETEEEVTESFDMELILIPAAILLIVNLFTI